MAFKFFHAQASLTSAPQSILVHPDLVTRDMSAYTPAASWCLNPTLLQTLHLYFEMRDRKGYNLTTVLFDAKCQSPKSVATPVKLWRSLRLCTYKDPLRIPLIHTHHFIATDPFFHGSETQDVFQRRALDKETFTPRVSSPPHLSRSLRFQLLFSLHHSRQRRYHAPRPKGKLYQGFHRKVSPPLPRSSASPSVHLVLPLPPLPTNR